MDRTPQRQAALGAAGPVVVLGAVLGLASVAVPDMARNALAIAVLAGLGCYVVGLRGVLILIPAASAFFLLNRIEEGHALHVGQYTIMVNYWLGVLVTLLLGSVAFVSLPRRRPAASPLGFFPGYFALGILALVLLGFAGMVVNGFWDRYILDRSFLAESLALGSVVLPMILALLITVCGLTKRQTVMCLRIMVGMAALTGFVMTVFGIMPLRIMGLLGWSRELGGGGGVFRGSTPLGHPNSVAAVLLLHLPFALMSGIRERSWIWTPYYLGSAVFILGGIVFSLSRAGLAVAIVVLAMCYAYILFSRALSPAASVGVTALSVAALIVGGAVLFTTYDFGRFWSRDYYEDASVERRMATVTTALRVFGDYPVLGVSPQALYPRYELEPDYVPAGMDQISPVTYYRGRITLLNPHNLYLTILVEYGVLGACVFFGILGLVFLSLVYAWWLPSGISADDRTAIAAMAFAFIGYMGVAMGAALFTCILRMGFVFWVFFGLALRFCMTAYGPKGETCAAGAQDGTA